MNEHFLNSIRVSTTINFFLDLSIFVVNRVDICIWVVFNYFGSSLLLFSLLNFFVLSIHKLCLQIQQMFMLLYKYLINISSYMIRVTANLVKKFSGTKIKIPQQEEGDAFCSAGKYNLAANSYSRVVEIINSAKINEQHNDQYSEAISKLAACQYLNNKNQKVADTLKMIGKNAINQKYQNYLAFLEENNKFVLQSKDQDHNFNSNNSKQIKNIVSKLRSKNYQENNEIENNSFPVLNKISSYLNNRTNYQKCLISLIQRSPKSPKSQKPSDQLLGITKQKLSLQLLLLYYMGTILNNKTLATADKAFINDKVNQILKDYETNRQKEIYKPLLVIIMSLIGEKHYMSAQGMIGHVKTEELTFINSYQSQDRNLVNNIYRMLVTRANNEPFELGWAKEEPILLGNLVVQRIIKAPLSGHPIEGLIC